MGAIGEAEVVELCFADGGSHDIHVPRGALRADEGDDVAAPPLAPLNDDPGISQRLLFGFISLWIALVKQVAELIVEMYRSKYPENVPPRS